MPIATLFRLVIIGIASFTRGCFVPVAYSWVYQAAKCTVTSPLICALLAFLLAFGLASAGLVYLSTLRIVPPILIVLSFVAGFGITRWLRGAYRRAT
jgi:hypothetical protein